VIPATFAAVAAGVAAATGVAVALRAPHSRTAGVGALTLLAAAVDAVDVLRGLRGKARP